MIDESWHLRNANAIIVINTHKVSRVSILQSIFATSKKCSDDTNHINFSSAQRQSRRWNHILLRIRDYCGSLSVENI